MRPRWTKEVDLRGRSQIEDKSLRGGTKDGGNKVKYNYNPLLDLDNYGVRVRSLSVVRRVFHDSTTSGASPSKNMRLYRLRFKTVVKICVAVFVVTTFIVHYTNEKYERTGQILKGIGNRKVMDLVQPFADTFLINNHWLRAIGNNNDNALSIDNTNSQVQNDRDDQLKTEPEDPYLVVVITSLPTNIERRSIIRNSWMKYEPEKSTIVVFFCGRPRSQDMVKLQKESEKYGDLIVDDFEESYYGLTVKSLRILKWFNMNLPKSKFLVKTDDDVFVNTPRLIQHLQRVETNLRFESKDLGIGDTLPHYMGGVVFVGRSPHTINTFSKWYVPPKLWKEQVVALAKLVQERGQSDHHQLSSYPPYLEGNFYVMAGHTVPILLNSSLHLPLFHLEDVYMSGFLGSEMLDIKLEMLPNVYSDSAIFPSLNYKYNKLFTSPKDIVAYHCDKDVDIIKQIYEETLLY